MRRLLVGMLLCATVICTDVVLTSCQGATKKTATPAAPAHNVPPAVYPAPNSGNPAVAGQDSQAYPAPQDNSSAASGDISSGPYPGPGGTTPIPNEYAPAPGDENLTRGKAFVTIKDSGVLMLESAPVQVMLHLKGSLPSPCSHLRVNPSQPNDQKRIDVEVYSVAKPGEVCVAKLQDFDVNIPLGSFPSGHYSIYIDGELLGEFDA